MSSNPTWQLLKDPEWRFGFDFCSDEHFEVIVQRFKDAREEGMIKVRLPLESYIGCKAPSVEDRKSAVRFWLHRRFEQLAKIKNLTYHFSVEGLSDYVWDTEDSAQHALITFASKRSPSKPTWEDAEKDWPSELLQPHSEEFKTLCHFFGKPSWYMAYDDAKKLGLCKNRNDDNKACKHA